jgi:hypothetical protein
MVGDFDKFVDIYETCGNPIKAAYEIGLYQLKKHKPFSKLTNLEIKKLKYRAMDYLIDLEILNNRMLNYDRIVNRIKGDITECEEHLFNIVRYSYAYPRDKHLMNLSIKATTILMDYYNKRGIGEKDVINIIENPIRTKIKDIDIDEQYKC